MTIQEFINKHKLPKFRLKQFNLAFYQQLIDDFDQLTTWSKDLRDKLKSTTTFSSLEVIKELISANQSTIKVLCARKSDGKKIEVVLMQHKDGRNSVCVSSMIGCPVGCKFCATGKMGFLGNLTAEEIVDQVLYFARKLKKQNKKVTNVVFMGMGEPLLNLSAVWQAIQILTDPEKFALSKRRITISTAGFAREFKQLVDLGFRGRVAISLHAANQNKREKLMPAAKLYSIKELIKTIDEYIKLTNKRVTYEYILIDNINASDEDAIQLAKLLKGQLCHVNLIPYNPVEGESFVRPSKAKALQFAKVLEKNGIANTIRATMGDDIKAACGQLAVKN